MLQDKIVHLVVRSRIRRRGRKPVYLDSPIVTRRCKVFVCRIKSKTFDVTLVIR